MVERHKAACWGAIQGGKHGSCYGACNMCVLVGCIIDALEMRMEIILIMLLIVAFLLWLDS